MRPHRLRAIFLALMLSLVFAAPGARAAQPNPASPADDERSALVTELASSFVQLSREAAPSFTKAYFRFAADGLKAGSNGSHVTLAGVRLFDPFTHQAAFKRLNELSLQLLKALGKEKGVILLIVDPAPRFEVKFEFKDLGRWRITKLDGRTGVPEGL